MKLSLTQRIAVIVGAVIVTSALILSAAAHGGLGPFSKDTDAESGSAPDRSDLHVTDTESAASSDPKEESPVTDTDDIPESTGITDFDPDDTEPLPQEHDSDNTIRIDSGNGPDFKPDDSSLSALSSAIERFGRPTGLVCVDLGTGMTISYNADAKMSPASIIKAVYVLYVCRCIDEGLGSLDEKITYTSADSVHENGVIGKSGVGSVYTVGEVIYHTVITSDNEGYYMLLRRFGRSGASDFMRELGCTSGLVSTSKWPNVTAADFARVWRAIYDYREVSETGRWLYTLFLNVDQMHFVSDILGLETANKAGWNSSAFNDTCIVYGNRTYILVLLTGGSYYTADKTAFSDIVTSVDDIMNEYSEIAPSMPYDGFTEVKLKAPEKHSPPVIPDTDTEPVTDTDTDPITDTDTEYIADTEPTTDTEPVADTVTDDIYTESEEITDAETGDDDFE